MLKAILKKLEEALEDKEGKPLMIGFLDESIVADCTRKSRVINTQKISTLNTYRSRRLFSFFGFLSWGGESVVQTATSCKKADTQPAVARRDYAYQAEDFLEFLKCLRRANRDKWLIIILDNARIHRAKIIKQFCQRQGIILVYLPPYSPTLNPIEFLWKDVKKKLSQYYREPLDNLKLQGAAIAQKFCQSRQHSYTQKWREKFL